MHSSINADCNKVGRERLSAGFGLRLWGSRAPHALRFGVLRRSRVCSLAAVVIAAAACGLPPGPSDSPSSSSGLHGEITDPAGDTQSDARVRIAPDLIRATADVGGGNITVVIHFAPGTFDHQTTRVSVLLDTDLNTSTGIAQRPGLGADYGIDFVASTTLANVTRADP